MTAIPAAPPTGGHTLEAFADARRLNEWILSKLASGLSGDVLEIGSGIGNMSRLVRPHVDRLLVTDTEPFYLDALARAFDGDAMVEVAAYDLNRPPPAAVAARRFDAIVAINVIEHIADDRALVESLAGLLRPGGRLLIYVPAVPLAFGTLDVNLDHYRRYTPATLTSLLTLPALDPGQPRYMNLLGLMGWFFNGRVLKRKAVSQRAVALFESLVPLVRLEDNIRLPIGLGLFTQATKSA